MSKRHRFQYVMDELAEHPGYLQRPMFGSIGCYFQGKFVAILADREPPWRGLVVPTEKDQHAAILADFPMLFPHPILPKWLMLEEDHDDFEEVATRIVECIREEDPRFGVIPKPKKKRKKPKL